MTIVNNTVPLALKNLGYTEPEVDAIVKYVDEKATIEGAPASRRRTCPSSTARARI